MSETVSTFYLFAQPSFIEGMGRVLDLGSNLQNYNQSPTSEEADYNALLSDWLAVGDDIRSAIKKYESTRHTKK